MFSKINFLFILLSIYTFSLNSLYAIPNFYLVENEYSLSTRKADIEKNISAEIVQQINTMDTFIGEPIIPINFTIRNLRCDVADTLVYLVVKCNEKQNIREIVGIINVFPKKDSKQTEVSALILQLFFNPNKKYLNAHPENHSEYYIYRFKNNKCTLRHILAI